MTYSRQILDNSYDLFKEKIFRLTKKDPQIAHEAFTKFAKLIYHTNLEDLIKSEPKKNDIIISNAAGFNKDGEIPPSVLEALGFDRVVIGTVTYDKHAGNPRPTIERHPLSQSLINWMGLPGIGAVKVAENLSKYDFTVPITINLMSTPGKIGDEQLRDIENTVLTLREFADIFELNISCPNTHCSIGDARDENLRMLDQMVYIVRMNAYKNQKVNVKVSPDSTLQDVKDTVEILNKYNINGIVTANTTTNHDREYIKKSPIVNGIQVGGASGNAVYDKSLKTQIMYVEEIQKYKKVFEIIACGGINSIERLYERLNHGAKEIQIFTPFIYQGPKLLTEFKNFS